jgi:hypothetical protein
VPTSAAAQTLALSAHTIDAVGFSKLAAVQTARSWSGIAEATFTVGGPGPWALIDAGLASAESFVIAQTAYAHSIVDAAARALGVAVGTPDAPPAPDATIEPAVKRTPKGSGARVPRTSKSAVKANVAEADAPSTTGSSTKGASRRLPAAD